MSNEQKITTEIKVPNEDLETLKIHFPHCFDKDGNFQFEKFKNNLTEKEINFSTESYGLDWLGKSYARLLASDPATTLLKADETHNAKPENANSDNLLIKGDNLEVLKHLVNAYYEQVKMIYIDPPYNTGSDGFTYQDDRKFTVKELQQLIGIDEEKAKRILDFTKQKSNSHSAWLTFMYPRLYIAKQLLKDEGVIFISIDDNEVASLRLLMDEIFGEENFIASMIWKTGRKSMAKLIATNHEYCVIYANLKNKQSAEEIINEDDESEVNGKLWRERKQGLEPIYKRFEELKAEFGNDYAKISNGLKDFYDSLGDDNPSKAHDHYNLADATGVFFAGDISQGTGDGGRFDILHPVTNKPCKVPNGGWRFNENNLPDLLEKDLIYFGSDEKTIPCLKRYLHLTEFEVPSSVFYRDARGAKKRLKKLFGGADVFAFPKDEEVIKKFIRFCVLKGDIVLDFFAGSGTTAEAIYQLNSEDGGDRKFITVQIPEPIDPKKKESKAAYEFVLNTLKSEPTIFEVTKERIIRAGNKIKSEIEASNKKAGMFPEQKKQVPDVGFKIFETTPIWEDYNFEAEQFDSTQTCLMHGKLTEDDIKALLTTWKTYDGIALTQELEKIDLSGYTAYYGNGKLYLMDKGFTTDNLKHCWKKLIQTKILNPTVIIAFGYHLESKNLRELSENVKSYANKKNIDIDFITRY
jgi:adenine-specific DNA-methyltransferase